MSKAYQLYISSQLSTNSMRLQPPNASTNFLRAPTLTITQHQLSNSTRTHLQTETKMSPLAPPYLPYLLEFTNESNHNNTDVSWLTKHSSLFNNLFFYFCNLLSASSSSFYCSVSEIHLCLHTHAQHAHSVTIRDTEFFLLYTANTPQNI